MMFFCFFFNVKVHYLQHMLVTLAGVVTLNFGGLSSCIGINCVSNEFSDLASLLDLNKLRSWS